MKIFIFALSAVLFLLYLSSASSENQINSEKKIKTTMSIRSDYVHLDKGGDLFNPNAMLFWHYDKRYGLGLNVSAIPKHDFVNINPFFSINTGPWFLISGFSTDSLGNDYFMPGFWYFKVDGIERTFIEVKNYFDISGNENDYLHFYAEKAFRFTKRISVGPAVLCNHWWKKEHDFYALGLVGYFKATDSMFIFVRNTFESDRTANLKCRSNKNRIGIEIHF